MKLKYYLRGLGIGIVVTAFLMGVALSGRRKEMTDDEIRTRALELGMVEEDSGVLAEDLGDETVPVEATEQLPVEGPVISGNETEAGVTGEGATEETETKPQETAADGTTEAGSSERSVIITVKSGDGSRSVANRLQEAGVIPDAAAFDTFLCQNGYDKRIASGDHEIPMGATNEEIAQALTR